MAKYHINSKGVPATCRATKGNCPFGGAESHYATKEEAQKMADEVNSREFGLLPDSSLNLSPSANQKLGKQMVVLRDKINPEKFEAPVGNMGINKPSSGGFWTSSALDNGESGWTKMTRERMFYRNQRKRATFDIAEITVSPDARVLTINNEEDYKKILEKYKEPKDKYEGEIRVSVSLDSPDELLDFDLLQKDYDAIRLTENGIKENEQAFRHWEMESTLWFNLDKFESVDYKEKGYKEKKIW